jgi:hypothetical protein
METSKSLGLILAGGICIYIAVFGLTVPFQLALVSFTDFTEVDPATYLAVSSSRITFTNVPRNVDAYVYKNMGSGYFTNFEHKFDFAITACEDGSMLALWGISNQIDDTYAWTTGLILLCNPLNVNIPRVFLDEINVGIGTMHTLAVNTNYYVTIARSGTTFSLVIRTGSHTGTIVAQSSITVTATAYQYMYGFSSCNSGGMFSSLRKQSGYVENLDLQGGTSPPDTGNLRVIGYADGTAVQFSAYYIGPSGQGPTVTVPASGYTWSNLAPGTYTVYGTYNSIQKNQQVTVVAGQTASATLTFAGTPPQETPDFLKWIKDLLNNATVKSLMLIGGVGMAGLGVIGLVMPGKKSYSPPPPPSYY